jgi:hypothetical protein
MSREFDRLAALRNALAVYRLAFGQARQEDVIDHLLTRLGLERAQALCRAAHRLESADRRSGGHLITFVSLLSLGSCLEDLPDIPSDRRPAERP